MIMVCCEYEFFLYRFNAGVRNIKALELIAANQSILYDFKFHAVPFHTDYPVVVLSESKSLVKVSADVGIEDLYTIFSAIFM